MLESETERRFLLSVKLPKDELGVNVVPREIGKLPVRWPKDELAVMVAPREIGEPLWKGVFGVGTVLVRRVAADEGVLQELPCS